MTGRFLVALVMLVCSLALPAQAKDDPAARVLTQWHRLVLELVRHTPTYSPPVASRSFAYLGVTAWEAARPEGSTSLAGQLTDMPPMPDAAPGLDPALVMQGAMARAVPHFFGNTGPTGQRAMAAMEHQLSESLQPGVAPSVREASLAHGKAIADAVILWASGDGADRIENMGFPLEWTLTPGPAHWVPTSAIVQQQAPLLPDWGKQRPFAMPEGNACPLPPPPAYSEDPGSPFHAEAVEVLETVRNLTDDQKIIARFWSDDPMLSPTPPGHWVTILLDISDREGLDAPALADALARLGIAVADAFIGCWYTKYDYDLLRPVTYIRRVIDPAFEPILITPPFPEYPSGHSTQSGAAAAVLTALFGEAYAFVDATHEDDGLAPRHFTSFAAAAEEAAMSRLYGGIHFRSAIERGLDQGACIGAHANGLKTR
ncbi:vanadium-dependent haloperoxidase [Gemmobacter denitrificans]|uniref:Vanadium-dependent haloperoxidase n=1 Tax=Gemmobacter denitrificans TaxID=3123040 RepID=A0ABU8BZS4_9RHOB